MAQDPVSDFFLESPESFPDGLAKLINGHESEGNDEPEAKRRKLNGSANDATAEYQSWILLRRIRIHVTLPAGPVDGPFATLLYQSIAVPLNVSLIVRSTNVYEHGSENLDSEISGANSLRPHKHPASLLSIHYSKTQEKRETLRLKIPASFKQTRFLDALENPFMFGKLSAKRLCRTSCVIIHATPERCVIEMNIRWRDSQLFEEIPFGDSQHALLKLLTADSDTNSTGAWSPRDFYNSVHVPDKEDKTYESLDVSAIQSTLFAFQKRTVQWMLKREGVDIQGRSLGTVRLTSKASQGWSSFQSLSHGQVFVNHWLGLVTTHESLMHDPYTEVSGGILAEEMGLGKTVEITALLLRHTRDPTNSEHNPKFDLPAANATLIVAPDSIIEQWASEINLHAPSLRCLLYPGVKGKGKNKETELLVQIQESDIVLCTYNTLASEVHYARDYPERNTRNKSAWQRERLRSPLVQLHWWRCVLDECQMIQSGVSAAAEVALQIPRQHAWAVSGTPLRKDPGDVYGLLRFLQLLPYSWSSRTWTRLLDQHQDVFKALINRIVIRHTKHLVKDELELPPQKRMISTISFTQIEEQHYSNIFDRMCRTLGLSRDGAPLKADWDPKYPGVIEQMRMWLTRLRQLCLHPDVGGHNQRALGGRAQDVLRSVEDVLQIMTDQNENALRIEQRSFYFARLRRGQLYEAQYNIQEALKVWKEVLLRIQDLVKRSRVEVETLVAKSPDTGHYQSSNDSGQRIQLNQLRSRLRLALELEHMAQFFIGNAYFQIKDNKDLTTPDSDEFRRLEQLEVSQYDAAKVLRLELLAEPNEEVQKLISQIDYEPQETRVKRTGGGPRTSVVLANARKGWPRIEERGGIEAGLLLDELDRCCDYYDRLIKQILEWRIKLTELLSKPLVDHDGDEIKGDEYEISTKEQDEVYTRMDVYRACVEDLSEMVTGQENALIKNETKTWAKLAGEGKGHAPGLMLELLELRQSLKPAHQFGSIRGVLAKMKVTGSALDLDAARDSRRQLEAHILSTAHFKFRTALEGHDATQKLLNSDVRRFIEIQNSRLEYYRQLQHISDHVAPWPEQDAVEEIAQQAVDEALQQQREAKLKKRIEEAQKKLDVEEAQLQANIGKKTSQARYLEHLKHASTLGEERKCIICQDERYEIGVLTACGHLFCKDCINVWLASHPRCPQCRTAIGTRAELYQITYLPQQLRMEQEEVANVDPDAMDISSAGSPRMTSIYSEITTQQLNEIKSIDLPRAFGTKIDFIARHIIWLRGADSNKTVIFSQFRDFCPGSLAKAFDLIGIRYAIVGGKIGVDRFKYDASIECLLMHAGSQASGLNLVNASNVLLCEPLVNTALELQAIARVHRIGQHRPTTVWMYLIEGTVEKAIYDLSVERRLDHLGKKKQQQQQQQQRHQSGVITPTRTDEDIEAVDAEEMNDRPLNTLLSRDNESGEIVGKEDLWQCLFGNVQPRRGLPEFEIESE